MSTALIINPNTSPEMTKDIRSTAERIFSSPWDCVVEAAPAGPESLESWRDYHLAAVCVLPLAAARGGADGIVLACFGDPGLYALKEISDVPVIGVAEAAMSQALVLGGTFGIVAGMNRAVALMDSMVRTYGLMARYAGTVPLGMRVLEFETHREKTMRALEAAASDLARRGADVLLLGCAGLTSYRRELGERLGMAVVDPVEAGCRMLQLTVDSGLVVSRAGLYARPAPQKMNHVERVFAPGLSGMLQEWEEGV